MSLYHAVLLAALVAAALSQTYHQPKTPCYRPELEPESSGIRYILTAIGH